MTSESNAPMEHFTASGKAPDTIPDDLRAFIVSRNRLDKVGDGRKVLL
jgi:hypothetical protein